MNEIKVNRATGRGGCGKGSFHLYLSLILFLFSLFLFKEMYLIELEVSAPVAMAELIVCNTRPVVKCSLSFGYQ